MENPNQPGQKLREDSSKSIVPLIGVYDVFSATIAARHFDGLFVSGFGFAASHYGLPDIGFIAWSDMVDFVRRIRAVLPDSHVVVDIDDGYVDTQTACHVVRLLEAAGASGVVVEDQKRPRRCGHAGGKQVLELESFLTKLDAVLATRQDLFVVARTDAATDEERMRRARAFIDSGADAVLMDAIQDLDVIRQLSEETGHRFVFNQIAGGKSPSCALTDLAAHGVSLVIYSTPCLFPAQRAVDAAMRKLQAADGLLPPNGDPDSVDLTECSNLLDENLSSVQRGARAFLEH